MFTFDRDTLVPGRECGACQVCCTAITIDHSQIRKRAGMPCRHSLQGGCDIHQTNPEVCRSFFCGWRRLAGIPADWRPEQSGILAIVENNTQPQFESVAVSLILTGNPLKIVRRPDFIDFVMRNVRSRVAIYLNLPGGIGMRSPRRILNTPQMLAAAARSRADVKAELEAVLKLLQDFPPEPYVMEKNGPSFEA